MNYRGITLTCIMYKVFCNILHCRLSKWAELNHKIPDEQNGFRARRSCASRTLQHYQYAHKVARLAQQSELQPFCLVDISELN